MRFTQYIGIDYSGAQTAEHRSKTLQVYTAGQEGNPRKIAPPPGRGKQWSRREIADYCIQALRSDTPVIIGIDHGFSFPLDYMRRYGLTDWDAFLQDFTQHWPAHEPGVAVESLRRGNRRTGQSSELRLCEQWTATAKSVFLFDVQGSVAKSTHAGLPWIGAMRQQADIRARTHFWPYDGFLVPEDKSVIAEVYPALYKRRYPKADRSPDEQDAWSVAAWLQEADRYGRLVRYFMPPLTPQEHKRAELEGWILGVY
jgi:hypothetical protein